MKTVAEWEQKRTIRYRQTISLWCWGYSYAAIASILGCTRQWCQQQIAPSVGMKRAVRARAQNRCEHCGIREKSARHHIHHVNRTIPHSEFSNLVPLCVSCHRTADIEQARVRRGWDQSNR
jgi:hypothetical protein